MKKLEFSVKIEGREIGVVAALTPPFDVVEVFGTRARVPVRGTINGYPFRSSLMPMLWAGRQKPLQAKFIPYDARM
jgi:hypothetical protein